MTEFDKWWNENTKGDNVAEWHLGFGSSHGAACAAWNEGMNRGAKYTKELASKSSKEAELSASDNTASLKLPKFDFC